MILRWLKQAIWINSRGRNTVNKDKGVYKLDKIYDQLILNRHSSSGMMSDHPPRTQCRFVETLHHHSQNEQGFRYDRNWNISSEYNFILDLYTRTFLHVDRTRLLWNGPIKCFTWLPDRTKLISLHIILLFLHITKLTRFCSVEIFLVLFRYFAFCKHKSTYDKCKQLNCTDARCTHKDRTRYVKKDATLGICF